VIICNSLLAILFVFFAVTDGGYSVFPSSTCVCQVEMHFNSDLAFGTNFVSN